MASPFTTLCAAANRLLRKAPATALLGATLRLARRAKLLKKRSALAAIDSTGLETRHVSAYYVRRCRHRKGHRRRRYPKLSAVCDTATHLVLGAVADRGPKPDMVEAEATLVEAFGLQPFATLVADAGYESEPFHRLCRDERGIRSIIPTTERGRARADGEPRALSGHYRRQMHRRFPKKTYGQRWQIETVFSMLKRNLGSALRARHHHSQVREIRVRVLTHNVMILIPPHRDVLYRAVPVPILQGSGSAPGGVWWFIRWRNSAANAWYAFAPAECGSYSRIDLPKPGASLSRTLRGMTVS